jgi:hypothetical protein
MSLPSKTTGLRWSLRAPGGRVRLTIVGGVRDALLVWLRGRWKTVCPRGAWPVWSRGPSTSPLDSTMNASARSEECPICGSTSRVGAHVQADALARLLSPGGSR